MPSVRTTQVQPPVSQLPSAVDSNGLLLGWQRGRSMLLKLCCCPCWERPTCVYVRPTDVSPVQAPPAFSLPNASVPVPSTLPAAMVMDVTQPHPQLLAFDPQTLSESQRVELEQLAMEMVFGKGSFSAAPKALAPLPTPDTTPVKSTVEMSVITHPADPTTINLSYADFSEAQPTLWVSAPQNQVEDGAVAEDEEDVDWGMYVNMEEMEEVV
ncbi:hypothetical protein L202_02504 [Cryptococcus amylolentus CBS 6039]|uniref:Uncharacterized protein n=1 Tax=Cryptococcus amylolentus CBS 6039 TaxID=1295533 RepID=A0A1E3I0X0_9TREE|nr:hypothetical protein L202_02504 [Cryptococcus amylolentus CBS 6039]ODN82217.1 hypothetical protein L202_02504 [Cryptococcus amylolentus CBS 6039]